MDASTPEDVYVEINYANDQEVLNPKALGSTTQKRACEQHHHLDPPIPSSARSLHRDGNPDYDSHHNHHHWNTADNHNGNSIAKRKLLQASVICALFMVIELIAGVFANSLALITDASHLLSDLSSFLISLFALWVSGLPGTIQLSFGYHRAEILSALISVLLIWVLTFFLVVEAVKRVVNPQPVNGLVMFITALFGTIANLVMTYILGVHSHGIGSAHAHNHDHDHDHDHLLEKNFEHSPTRNNNYSHPHRHEDLPFQEPRSLNVHRDADSYDPNASPDLLDAAPNPTHTVDGSASYRSVCHEDNRATGFGYKGLRQASFASELAEPLTMIDNSGRKNVNLRAAYIHVLGDLIQNIGVLIASALIWYNPSWSIVDPLCTFLFSVLVLTTTISILKEATNVLMEGTPSEVDLTQLRTALSAIGNVSELHDLHVWSLSVGKPSLACHIVVDSQEEARRVLRQATYICQNDFGILHTTIQIDFSANKLACGTDAHAKCH